eukprot:gnl/MRDRNA2_/MRDRNA2_20388_c0_seq1.p1 gnl/MRDRNA2_/MRDRNA2_20388_c0~~gnl/MRDRNA2_/MRDRNA2_20388_c0_seq1.p1  ORF type:complete len:313 (+),score=56.29 gnl/MRDRNA2_/MRDRNA2_20388_c0_seq1:33-941(+)
MAGYIRDPVAAETFFSQLPTDGLCCDELHLLEAFQQLANATRALQLPRGVSLQEWADRRVPDSSIDAVNASGLVYVAPRQPRETAGSASLQEGSWPPTKSGPSYSTSIPSNTSLPMFSAEGEPKKNIISRLFSGLWGVVTGRGKQEKDPYDEIGRQNDFYYDEVQRRWRQRGEEDASVDTSGIDPMTGRPILPSVANPQALAPPPMGSASSSSGASHLNRAGPAVGSLYLVETPMSQQERSTPISHEILQEQPVVHDSGIEQFNNFAPQMQPLAQPCTAQVAPGGGPGAGGPLSNPFAARPY